MKTIKLTYCIFTLALAILAISTGCKKTYITDEGVHSAKTSLSTFDYLQNHPYHIFDTLTTIIKHYNMQDEVNKAGTFFAATDYSINRYLSLQNRRVQMIDENAKFTMDSLYARLTPDSLRQYLFTKQIKLTDFTDELIHENVNLAKISCGIRRIKSTDGAYYQYSSAPVYFLYYVKINGAVDVPGQLPTPANPVDVTVSCQTQGIETSSGGVLHVLSNTHTFVTF
ncbi:hypothetical protein [Mucilaginibacter sp.]|uniref:hypothetical protein n=1 Tax=Mucilaginibacter sp. TaxID=1882438 RepID=UPI00326373FD